VLDPSVRERGEDLAVAIEVVPAGGAAADAFPESILRAALGKAQAFGEAHGVSVGVPRVKEPPAPLLVFDAEAVAARLLDIETGAVLGELPLAAPTPPADELLSMPESRVAGHDLLGL